MSISSMTNVALARRVYAPRVSAQPGAGVVAAVADGAGTPASQVTSALSVITTYIPTEILTLYVAARGALSQAGTMAQTGKTAAGMAGVVTAGINPSEWVAFGLSAAITPLVVWLVYAAKLRAAGKALPSNPRHWPVWEMVAGTIAFVVWALALPNSPFSYFSNVYSPAIAGVAVLVVSTILGLVAPIFGPNH